MSIVLKLKERDYQRIAEYCKNTLPNEACGLLAGVVKEEVTTINHTTKNCEIVYPKTIIKTITKIYLLSNMDASDSHFSMNPEEQFRAVKDARQNGAEIIGSFHSHPHSPATPSAEDKRLAYNPDIEYLILSLQEPDHPVLKAFGITQQKNAVVHKIEWLPCHPNG